MAMVKTRILPTCQRCFLPMKVALAETSGPSPRVLVECVRCSRLVELMVMSRLLRAGALAAPRNGDRS